MEQYTPMKSPAATPTSFPHTRRDEGRNMSSPSIPTRYPSSSHLDSSRLGQQVLGFPRNFTQGYGRSSSQAQLDNPFMQLQQMEHQLNQKTVAYERIKQELSHTKVELDTLKTAYDKLLLSVTESPALSSAIVKYDTPRFSYTDERPADLKKVRFWKRDEYLLEKKNKRGVTGVSRGTNKDGNGNTMTWYVQDKNGNAVDGERVSNIRQRARSIWQQLLRMGIAPNSWSQVGADAYDLYEYQMVARFPELSYCEDNWKAHMIASDNYPSWYSDHIKDTHIRVKAEPSPAPEALKRQASSPPADFNQAAKKPRKSKQEPAPPVPVISINDYDEAATMPSGTSLLFSNSSAAQAARPSLTPMLNNLPLPGREGLDRQLTPASSRGATEPLSSSSPITESLPHSSLSPQDPYMVIEPTTVKSTSTQNPDNVIPPALAIHPSIPAIPLALTSKVSNLLTVPQPADHAPIPLTSTSTQSPNTTSTSAIQQPILSTQTNGPNHATSIQTPLIPEKSPFAFSGNINLTGIFSGDKSLEAAIPPSDIAHPAVSATLTNPSTGASSSLVVTASEVGSARIATSESSQIAAVSGPGDADAALPPVSAIKVNNKKARAGTAMNAKSQCKREWILANPNGLEYEFSEYWEAKGKVDFRDWKAPK